MHQNFVLIGSAALSHSLPQIVPRDYDIITDTAGGGFLSLHAESKKGRLLIFSDCNDYKTNKVVDLKLCSDNKVVQQIYIDSQASNWKKDKLTLSSKTEIEVIIPSLAYLQALYKSHLHRIPSVFVDQGSNIEVWLRWMDNYSTARLSDYKSLDAAIESDPVVNRIYNLQFDYVTESLGDTFSMEKTDDEFFSDNVERLLPHDDVHKAVAQINRRTDGPLFPKFLVSPGSAKMSETLFREADRTEQINTIKEEIMVLWLERIMLPLVMDCDGKPLEIEPFLESSDKGGTLRDLMVHFVTNLCDNGHSWLRQWCIDHWKLFSELEDYPIDQLVNFANSFNPDLRLYGAQPKDQKLVSPVDMLTYYNNLAKHEDFQESLGELSDLLKKKVGRYAEHEFATFPCLSKELNNPKIQTFIEGIFVHSGTKEVSRLNRYSIQTTTTKKIGPIVKKLTLRLNTQSPLSLLRLVKKCVTAAPTCNTDITGAEEHQYLFFYNEDDDSDVELFIIYDITDGIGIYYDFEAFYMQMKHNSEPEVDEIPVIWDHQLRQKNTKEIEADTRDSNDSVEGNSFPSLEQVLENLFIMEIVFDDERCKFAIHFLEKEIPMSNDKSYDKDTNVVVEGNSTYFTDTRKSTYYVSTCSDSFKNERDLTYMNHYGNNDPKFESFLEALARLYMELQVDEESDDD